MNNKYEALEAMLANYFENGADIETVLAEYPEFADELRPLLQAAIGANALATPSVPADVARRGRTRLLQQAAQIRDAAPAPRASLFNFRLATIALTLLLVFFTGGTGLVRASSSALPGDILYTVKRSWENTRVWFADNGEILRLEAEFEDERREEVAELLVYSRVAIVEFEGEVTNRNGSKWEVAGVPVIVSGEINVDPSIHVGSDVIVSGRTESDGVVFATKIILSHPENENDATPTEMPDEDVGEAEDVEMPESEDDEEQGNDSEPEDDGESDDELEGGDESDDEEQDNDSEPEDDGESDDEPEDDGEADDEEQDDGSESEDDSESGDEPEGDGESDNEEQDDGHEPDDEVDDDD